MCTTALPDSMRVGMIRTDVYFYGRLVLFHQLTELRTVSLACRRSTNILHLKKIFCLFKMLPLQTEPDTECAKNTDKTIMWIIVKMLVVHFFTCLVRFRLVVAAYPMVLPDSKIVKSKDSNIHRTCHKVPLAQ